MPPDFYRSAPVSDSRAAAWEYLRRPGEVYRVGDTWYLVSYEAVRFAQRHPELFASGPAFDGLADIVQMIPLAIDPPQHAQYRRVLDPMLSPKRIDRLEDSLRTQLWAHIDAFAGTGECDVVPDLSLKFPTQVILTLLGLPKEDLPQFLIWVDGLIHGEITEAINNEPTELQTHSALSLFGYLQHQVELKRQDPGDDMLSDILALSGDDAWTEPEILGLCFVLVLVGLDTVTSTIGFCLLTLAQQPTLRQQLIDDTALIPAFVEEMLRLDGPVAAVPRATTTDVEVVGTLIPAGSKVMLVLPTANREARQAGNPELIDLTAKTTHLGFGGGIHRCLGSHLARRELRLTIEEFHARIPHYRTADGFTPYVAWPSGTLFLESLPLVFPPG